MTRRLRSVVESFAGLKAAVVGDAMLDGYLEGSSNRVAPEAPVPVVSVHRRTRAPGGAANVAANLVALGASARLVSVLGDDAEGAALRHEVARLGVDVSGLITMAGRRTLSKQRVVADGQIVVRLDEGSTDAVGSAGAETLACALEEAWTDSDVIVVSDYGYGALSGSLIARLRKLQADSPRVVVVDAKELHAYASVRPTAVKPNFTQALRLLAAGNLDDGPDRAEALRPHGELLARETGARIVAVTLDSQGAMIFERGRPAHRTYAVEHPRSQTAGAGDAFTACLALALAAGGDAADAAELAARAAAVSVAGPGTTTCSAGELAERLEESPKVLAGARIDRVRDALKARGKRIVFTNGCFDVIHRGHVGYLSEAKSLGDVLVVGVNSDASVRALKGSGRPVNTLEDRLEVLGALSCVDYLVVFDEPTPEEIIRRLAPDVFVKGGDYTIEMLPEATVVHELGGEVRLLPYLSNHSTTEVIARLDDARRRESSAQAR